MACFYANSLLNKIMISVLLVTSQYCSWCHNTAGVSAIQLDVDTITMTMQDKTFQKGQLLGQGGYIIASTAPINIGRNILNFTS